MKNEKLINIKVLIDREDYKNSKAQNQSHPGKSLNNHKSLSWKQIVFEQSEFQPTFEFSLFRAGKTDIFAKYLSREQIILSLCITICIIPDTKLVPLYISRPLQSHLGFEIHFSADDIFALCRLSNTRPRFPRLFN